MYTTRDHVRKPQKTPCLEFSFSDARLASPGLIEKLQSTIPPAATRARAFTVLE